MRPLGIGTTLFALGLALLTLGTVFSVGGFYGVISIFNETAPEHFSGAYPPSYADKTGNWTEHWTIVLKLPLRTVDEVSLLIEADSRLDGVLQYLFYYDQDKGEMVYPYYNITLTVRFIDLDGRVALNDHLASRGFSVGVTNLYLDWLAKKPFKVPYDSIYDIVGDIEILTSSPNHISFMKHCDISLQVKRFAPCLPLVPTLFFGLVIFFLGVILVIRSRFWRKYYQRPSTQSFKSDVNPSSEIATRYILYQHKKDRGHCARVTDEMSLIKHHWKTLITTWTSSETTLYTPLTFLQRPALEFL